MLKKMILIMRTMNLMTLQDSALMTKIKIKLKIFKDKIMKIAVAMKMIQIIQTRVQMILVRVLIQMRINNRMEMNEIYANKLINF